MGVGKTLVQGLHPSIYVYEGMAFGQEHRILDIEYKKYGHDTSYIC
jgi:hypothetical protein